jgi:hypothetical protein
MKTYSPRSLRHSLPGRASASEAGGRSAQASAVQRVAGDGLNDSPRAQAQRQRFDAAFGSTTPAALQLKGAGDALQLAAVEEEEPVQGRFEPAQRAREEEEPVQGRFEPAQRADDEELVQGRFAPAQRAGAGPLGAEPKRGGMPAPLKAGIEAIAGADLSDVQVHANSAKPARIDALAYAQGRDIHLGPGQEQHLPHEAWHIVQQQQGRVPATVQMAGVAVNDDAGLEHEADVMGDRAAAVGAQLVKAGRPG